MRFLRALGIALITGIAGAFLSIFASDYLTKLYHVSDMEGQRGMAIVFLYAPLGFIVGSAIGLVTGLRSRSAGFAGFMKAQGWSILITAAIGAITSGLLWLGADHPPRIDGKELVLEFELKIPPALSLPPEPNEDNIHVSLYANNSDNRFAAIDIHAITARDGVTIVPGSAALRSRSATRDLLVSIGNDSGASQFLHLKLPGNPGKENETWSDWIVATERADLTPVAEPERVAVRYRVQTAE